MTTTYRNINGAACYTLADAQNELARVQGLDEQQFADVPGGKLAVIAECEAGVAAFAAATLGRKGGQARTPAQQEARRKNGAKGGRPALPFVVVRTAFHRGGLVSRHRTREAAEAARHRFAARDCTCGCAVVVTREEYEALPGANDARSPYAPARRTTSH